MNSLVRRRAGDPARRRARARRRELTRTHWRKLLGLAAVILLAGAVSVMLAGLIVGAWLAWFVAGAVYGAGIAFWVAMFELIDPVGRHWWNGADGESFTARELRRRSRQGWCAVHNVMLESGDVDHIAIGPGGVVAIETKSSDADWPWLRGRSVHHGWADQARRSARRTRALVKQHAAIDLDVDPVVVVWATGLEGAGPVEHDGVRIVHGRELVGLLDARSIELTQEQIEGIRSALESYAQRLDRHVAARERQADRASHSTGYLPRPAV